MKWVRAARNIFQHITHFRSYLLNSRVPEVREEKIQIPAMRKVCVLVDEIRHWAEIAHQIAKLIANQIANQIANNFPRSGFPGPGCVSHIPPPRVFSCRHPHSHTGVAGLTLTHKDCHFFGKKVHVTHSDKVDPEDMLGKLKKWGDAANKTVELAED